MQTAATGYDLVLDPAAYAGIQLLIEDNIPMESPWHVESMTLLKDVTRYHCRGRDDYFVGGNNFIYFNPDQARNRDYRGPDYFYIKDGVDRTRRRHYWAIWEENGRCPDVIIELLSPSTEQEDRTTKFTIYEQTLRTPEYFLYDHDTERLEGWRLIGDSYAALPENEQGWLWSEELGLWLGTWVGEVGEFRDNWLRMYTAEGHLVPTVAEAERKNAKEQRKNAQKQRRNAEEQRRNAEEQRKNAEEQRRRADEQQQRAEQAEQELARLRSLLQQAPTKPNGTSPKS